MALNLKLEVGIVLVAATSEFGRKEGSGFWDLVAVVVKRRWFTVGMVFWYGFLGEFCGVVLLIVELLKGLEDATTQDC